MQQRDQLSYTFDIFSEVFLIEIKVKYEKHCPTLDNQPILEALLIPADLYRFLPQFSEYQTYIIDLKVFFLHNIDVLFDIIINLEPLLGGHHNFI